MFECVINVSEGRDLVVLSEIASACAGSLRDSHSDEFHNRSVFTLINEPDLLQRDVRALIEATFERLDLRRHEGVHPRFGVVDVVPFVALDPTERSAAIALRDATGGWIASTFAVPVFFYGAVDGGERTLPEVRKLAFDTLAPDIGPATRSPRLGAVALGERPILLAWNLWLRDVTLEHARKIAAGLRRAEVRSLAFQVGAQVQVSCNLIDPEKVGPSMVYDQVLAQLSTGEEIDHAELVGLAPASVLQSEPHARWAQLGLSSETTIESRLA
jgi:glutamate formiminotransferase